ncbi:MAG: electron transfer flavoprotein subunit alpha/FixB family protein [Synergistaceae bacterium]|jgi:electron transfer flavoprotein alpha subunit|nr:electron transfer flavoprotein subunit alpha/FixB family protein [Synergistaceae bacterium]
MSQPKFVDEVWVLGEAGADGTLIPAVFELSGRARELADALASSTGRPHGVTVLLTLDGRTADRADPGEAGPYGADRVWVVSAEFLPFDRAACAKILVHLAKAGRPQIILAPATAFGRSVMPYAAALLGTGLTADCTGLSIERESGLLLQTRPATGGNIMATIKTPDHRPQMATVRPKAFGVPKPTPGRNVSVVTPDLPEYLKENLQKGTVRTVKFSRFAEDEGTLQDREVIVSGGKGLRRPEGFELLSKLSSLLGAGIGASRPVVEMKWIGYPHQVGLSGCIVSPRVYIALGISGAVQHLAGMQTAEKIVSVNRDPEAQIFSVSDVAICGDLYEVLPKLIEKIESRKLESGKLESAKRSRT